LDGRLRHGQARRKGQRSGRGTGARLQGFLETAALYATTRLRCAALRFRPEPQRSSESRNRSGPGLIQTWQKLPKGGQLPQPIFSNVANPKKKWQKFPTIYQISKFRSIRDKHCIDFLIVHIFCYFQSRFEKNTKLKKK